jgi:hypothetical protein
MNIYMLLSCSVIVKRNLNIVVEMDYTNSDMHSTPAFSGKLT